VTPDRIPTPRAVALSYDQNLPEAPRVVARGVGELAEHILALADGAGVPVRREPELVGWLGSIELGAHLPEELWAAAAELLAFLLELEDDGAPK